MATEITRPVDGALYLASKGFKVFPLRSGDKRPSFEGWQEWATTDKSKILSWSAANAAANWGVFAGGSGLCVIDLDKKEGRDGEASLMDLELAEGSLPTTLTVRTPTGGKHLYFVGNIKNSVDTLGRGIDTRGVGGYVVAPGSVVEVNGNDCSYTLELDVPAAAAPEWIAKRLGDTTKTALERPDDHAVEKSISQGGRDNELTRWAGVLRGQGLAVEEMEAALLVMNELRCNPPLPEEDVKRIAASIGKKPRGEAQAFVDFLPPAPEEEKKHTFWANEIDIANIQPVDWIVKGRFARKFVTVTLAPGGVGKTRVAMSECVGVATGIPGMLGNAKLRSQGAAWYYSTEDPRCALEERVAGLLSKHRLTPSKVPFAVTSGQQLPLVLVSREDGKYVVNEEMVKHIIQTIQHNKIALMVIDPFVKCHMLDENDNAGIDKVAATMARIADEGNCAVHVIHHTRKLQEKAVKNFRGDMDVSRGASALVSAARIAHTLTRYNHELDGDNYQVAASEAWRWVRLDDAKDNLAPRTHNATWWHLESLRLPCHVDPEDSVGVAVAREPGRFDDGVREELNHGMVAMVGQYLDALNTDEIKMGMLVRGVGQANAFKAAREIDGWAGADLRHVSTKLRELFGLGYEIGHEKYTMVTKGGTDWLIRERGDPPDFLS